MKQRLMLSMILVGLLQTAPWANAQAKPDGLQEQASVIGTITAVHPKSGTFTINVLAVDQDMVQQATPSKKGKIEERPRTMTFSINETTRIVGDVDAKQGNVQQSIQQESGKPKADNPWSKLQSQDHSKGMQGPVQQTPVQQTPVQQTPIQQGIVQQGQTQQGQVPYQGPRFRRWRGAPGVEQNQGQTPVQQGQVSQGPIQQGQVVPFQQGQIQQNQYQQGPFQKPKQWTKSLDAGQEALRIESLQVGQVVDVVYAINKVATTMEGGKKEKDKSKPGQEHAAPPAPAASAATPVSPATASTAPAAATVRPVAPGALGSDTAPAATMPTVAPTPATPTPAPAPAPAGPAPTPVTPPAGPTPAPATPGTTPTPATPGAAPRAAMPAAGTVGGTTATISTEDPDAKSVKGKPDKGEVVGQQGKEGEVVYHAVMVRIVHAGKHSPGQSGHVIPPAIPAAPTAPTAPTGGPNP